MPQLIECWAADENVDNMTEVNPFRQDQDGGIHAGVVEGPGGYYFGIIDTLQEWTWRKRVETSFKVYIRSVLFL